jgi:hypothetical protein
MCKVDTWRNFQPQHFQNSKLWTVQCLTAATQKILILKQPSASLESEMLTVQAVVNMYITLSRLCHPAEIMKIIVTNTIWWEDDDNDIFEIIPFTCLVISGHGLFVSINSMLLYQTLNWITNSFIYTFQLKSWIICLYSCEWAVYSCYQFQHTSWFLLLHLLDFNSEHILLCKNKVIFIIIIIILVGSRNKAIPVSAKNL